LSTGEEGEGYGASALCGDSLAHMRILITGSAGHLGEALVRTLRACTHDVIGLDRLASPHTDVVGSILDRDAVVRAMNGADVVLHAATLHKPHIATHTARDFVAVNVVGTLNLLEAAVEARVRAFVYTSTTSVFGAALRPPPGAPAVWVTEDLEPVVRNIYGVTKRAAEDLCELFHRERGLPCIVLRTSRFFPEEDDHEATRRAYADENVKANEFLYRRVDIEDAVSAHLCAIEKAESLGFGRYIVSATTPFERSDAAELGADAPAVLARRVPEHVAEYGRRDWAMYRTLDRVYDNARARRDLGWAPQHDFRTVLARLESDADPRSALAREVGYKGYHRR
jgi:nucleoside-diphosphate-sugar epimerase